MTILVFTIIILLLTIKVYIENIRKCFIKKSKGYKNIEEREAYFIIHRHLVRYSSSLSLSTLLMPYTPPSTSSWWQWLIVVVHRSQSQCEETQFQGLEMHQEDLIL